MFTRQGLEEYITDAVIALDHRVHEQISTRRIRVVKYRGSTHGTNEYPFLIDRDGITVLPVTSLLLEHEAPDERVSTRPARARRDARRQGLLPRAAPCCSPAPPAPARPRSPAHFVDAACARGEKCLYFLFEESPQQMIRNMRSAGIDLRGWVDKGLLQFHADRPNRHGLETHLLEMHHAVEVFDPDVVVMDPDHQSHGGGHAIRRARHAHARHRLPEDARHHRDVHQPHVRRRSRSRHTESMISSLMDTWILVAVHEQERKRQRLALRAQVARHAAFGRSAAFRASATAASTSRRTARSPRRKPCSRVASARRATKRAARDEASTCRPRNTSCACTSRDRRRRPCAPSPTCARSATNTCGPLQHRGRRPGRKSRARPRRPDPRPADAGAPAADAHQEDHRRPLQHRARARGARPAPAPAQRVSRELQCTPPMRSRTAAYRTAPVRDGHDAAIHPRHQRRARAVRGTARRAASSSRSSTCTSSRQLIQGEQIVATPTLIKYEPAPLRRIIGDMTDIRARCASASACAYECPA